MAKVYVLKITDQQLENSTDMLRYDDAFRYRKIEGGWEIEMLRYTPDRWQSFGVNPTKLNITSHNITQKQWSEYANQGGGFTEGIRFAQDFLRAKMERYALPTGSVSIIQGK